MGLNFLSAVIAGTALLMIIDVGCYLLLRANVDPVAARARHSKNAVPRRLSGARAKRLIASKVGPHRPSWLTGTAPMGRPNRVNRISKPTSGEQLLSPLVVWRARSANVAPKMLRPWISF